MTNADYTALEFLVDASGSMASIVHDMEIAMEALLAQQKALPGKLTVGVTYFDAPYGWGVHSDHLHVWYNEEYVLADPDKVKIHLKPGGGTALNDALGTKITGLGAKLAEMPEDERPGQVIFAIVTDGGENSSRTYSGAQVKEMIEHQREVYGWNFVYIGANQDAIGVGTSLGIPAGSTLTWNPNNVYAATHTLNTYVTSTRSLGSYEFTDEDRAKNA